MMNWNGKRLKALLAVIREGTRVLTPQEATDFRDLTNELAVCRPYDDGIATLQALGVMVYTIYGDPERRPLRYWIYPGDRRPVVVAAHDETEAEAAVRASPMYDGFGGRVCPIEEFAALCAKAS